MMKFGTSLSDVWMVSTMSDVWGKATRRQNIFGKIACQETMIFVRHFVLVLLYLPTCTSSSSSSSYLSEKDLITTLKESKIPGREFRSRLYTDDMSPTLKSRQGSKGRNSPKIGGMIGGSIAIIVLLIEGLSKLGSYQSILERMEYPTIPRGITELTVVFAGADTNDNLVEDLQVSLSFRTPKNSKVPQGFVIRYPILDTPKLLTIPPTTVGNSILQPQNVGERMGYEVARRLPARIRKLHVVGISTGSHAADALVRILKARSNPVVRSSSSSSTTLSSSSYTSSRRPIYIQQTFINPHCTRGQRNERSGDEEFGKWADYAQQIYVRRKTDQIEDPYATNDICTKCAILDVTSCRPKGISDRDWPLVFLLHRLSLGFVSDAKKCKRGTVSLIRIRNKGTK
jgi:hypothetical protein